MYHSIIGKYSVYNSETSNRSPLYENGQFNRGYLGKGLVCEEDVMQGVRKSALIEDLSKIEKFYMERNGEISAIKKH